MARRLPANRSRFMARDGSRRTPTSHRPGFALYRPLPPARSHGTLTIR